MNDIDKTVGCSFNQHVFDIGTLHAYQGNKNMCSILQFSSSLRKIFQKYQKNNEWKAFLIADPYECQSKKWESNKANAEHIIIK